MLLDTVPADPAVADAVPVDPAVADAVPADPAVAGAVPADPAVAGAVPADPAVAGAVPADPAAVPAAPTVDRSLVMQLSALLVLAVVAVAVAVLVGEPNMADLRARFDHPAPLTALAFAALYAAITLAPLPKAVFTIAAGALFGVPAAMAIVLTGALAGAIAAFYIGRVLGRHAAERFVGRRLAGLDALLIRRGLWVVAGLRLVPLVPFTAMNYLSGLTAVRLAPYVIGSLLGMSPATAAYVVVGSYGAEPGSWPFMAALAGLLALTVMGVVAATRHRRLQHRAQSP